MGLICGPMPPPRSTVLRDQLYLREFEKMIEEQEQYIAKMRGE
jgi:hypothetical protein